MVIIKDQIMRIDHKGPSINDLTHFLIFLTPPSPLSPVLLNRLMELRHLLADPPLPNWMTLFVDGPISHFHERK